MNPRSWFFENINREIDILLIDSLREKERTKSIKSEMKIEKLQSTPHTYKEYKEITMNNYMPIKRTN